ncbi:hypothetical protein F5Y08DRAFT_304257 [Xylaria arbuscula]|nr:hypothetical protein F5Y08DRAFT_304257 [Xylaria arbuscula]
MGSASVLSAKDANSAIKNLAGTGAASKADIKSMEYHRQVLKSKMEEEKYGHTATTTTTSIITIANNTATTTTVSPPVVGVSSSSSSSSGLGTTTTVNSMQASTTTSSSSSPKKIIHIHRTLAGLAADPNASGARSSAQQYISPSDNIMSPCTAKLNALKGRHAGKAKPKSLFAQASAKKFVGENVFGARSAEPTSSATAAASNSN